MVAYGVGLITPAPLLKMEEKYIQIINMTCEKPFYYTKRDLIIQFKIYAKDLDWLITTLCLDVYAYRLKNEATYLLDYMKSNPELTPDELIKETGCSKYMIYRVARKNNIAFKNL